MNDHLYTEDDTFVTGIDTSIAELTTPLRRLANTSVNDARQNVSQLHNQTENSRAMKYKMFEAPSPNMQRAPEESGLVPLGKTAFQLQMQRDQLKSNADLLFETGNQAHAPAPDVQLYSSLSRGGPIVLKDFLPPRITPRNKNPIVVAPQYRPFGNGDDDEDEFEAPSGEWTSPVIQEALRRQVNKEQQFKTLWRRVASLFCFHMTLLLAEYLYFLYEITYHDENQMYRNTMWTRLYSLKGFQSCFPYILSAYHHVRDLQWILVALIFTSIIRLFIPQDQCKDLPLTNHQRSLIGLKPLEENGEVEGVDSNLIVKQRLFKATTSAPLLVPKYTQENELSGIVRPNRTDDTEVAIALKDLLPARKLRRS